jgi:DNA-binding NtrC family response regulator
VVAEAGNIQDAQVLAETAIFDLAILDINIAGSTIVPVAEIIDRRGLPFVFISGYGSGGRPEAFIERPALQKPLLLSKLGETIDSILSTPDVPHV